MLQAALDTDLSDHPGDVAGVGRQQDGVGLLGQVGERRDVLLSHAEGGRRVAVLKKQTKTRFTRRRQSSDSSTTGRSGFTSNTLIKTIYFHYICQKLIF